MANTIKFGKKEMEYWFKQAMQLTPEEMAMMTPEQIRAWQALLNGR